MIIIMHSEDQLWLAAQIRINISCLGMELAGRVLQFSEFYFKIL